MGLNTSKCNHLMPLHCKWLEPGQTHARCCYRNELSQSLVRYCSVEDATLEGARLLLDDSVVNNVRTLTNYVS